jgi:hypothetical protein
MTVRLAGFAAEAVGAEAARLGISPDELVSFSALYYLADVDSGRIGPRVEKSPFRDKGPRSEPGAPVRGLRPVHGVRSASRKPMTLGRVS